MGGTDDLNWGEGDRRGDGEGLWEAEVPEADVGIVGLGFVAGEKETRSALIVEKRG